MELDPIPDVLVAVSEDASSGVIRAQGSAIEIRTALRAVGIPTYLYRVHQGVPRSSRERPVVVLPIAESMDRDGAPGLGELRTALEQAEVPFFGSATAAYRRASDKRQARAVLIRAGLQVAPGMIVSGAAELKQRAGEICRKLQLPLVVKPVLGIGGSVGVHYVKSLDELLALPPAQQQPPELLVESYVHGQELAVWVIGRRPVPEQQVVLEVDRGGYPIFDRDGKLGLRRKAKGDTGSRVARLTPDLTRRVQEAAVAAHRAVGAYSYSCVDLILAQDQPVVIEVNPAPRFRAIGGLTIHAGRGQTFGEMLARLVGHGLKRYQDHCVGGESQ